MLLVLWIFTFSVGNYIKFFLKHLCAFAFDRNYFLELYLYIMYQNYLSSNYCHFTNVNCSSKLQLNALMPSEMQSCTTFVFIDNLSFCYRCELWYWMLPSIRTKYIRALVHVVVYYPQNARFRNTHCSTSTTQAQISNAKELQWLI